MNGSLPHQRNLRKGRHPLTGYAYAITKCTADRKAVLLNTLPDGRRTADILVATLRNLQGTDRWVCFGYVIMPDHVHFVVRIKEDDLSGLVGAFCKHTSRETNRLSADAGPLWQEGFYDHAIRGEKSLRTCLEYIRYNPVRAGLAAKPDDWPYGAIFPEW